MKSKIDISEQNESICRIDEKCIDCGICKETCESNNGIYDDCINCGQCIITCPTKAIQIKSSIEALKMYLNNPEYCVVVSTSPSVRVAIGDAFSCTPGEFLEGKMVHALKELGFDYVFDTTFGADLTTQEEAMEFLNRFKKNENLPMFTSCCPSWVLYMEKYHANDLNLLSSVKSPIGMQGMMVKEFFGKSINIPKEKIIHVALTPCVSKKSEVKRKEIDGTDIVITTVELATMIKEQGIDFISLPDSKFDNFFGKGSGAGVIFGTSGGVTESALRTAYYFMFQEEAPKEFFLLENVRGSSSMKEAVVDFKGTEIKILVINEIKNVEKLYSQFKNYHFIEVMTCPGGCIGGAGQPIVKKMLLESTKQKRMESLYLNDSSDSVRTSYQNPNIKKIYEEFLNKPNSDVCIKYLHTTYESKEVISN